MIITNTSLPTRTIYYPLGNTPPVCLTQDLPPEQDADILLLGCGDARNVLFTCFIDKTRKIDVTCCDIEPGIHARNILLYTLLIDDEADNKIQLIWNIYYHLKIDKKSLKLLETQAEKLLRMSESYGLWHSSVYGSSIKFCDERSLSSVRCYWSGFTSYGLSPDQKKDRLSHLESSMLKAKFFRQAEADSKGIKNRDIKDISGLRSTLPALNIEAVHDLSESAKKWWECGTVSLSGTSHQKLEFNPAFLFSPNQALTIFGGIAPLHGFPLSSAYTPIKEGAFCMKKSASSMEHLVNCAMTHFTQWASAFRKAVESKLIIRIFSGNALAFCFTLRNSHLNQSRSMNLSCHNRTSCLLNLHPSCYGNICNNAAPLTFDIVDTSNLADHLGSLNITASGCNLLKHHTSSTLYTETLVQFDTNNTDRLDNFFGVDVCCMSLLLGLVLPDSFTNAAISVDEDLTRSEVSKLLSGVTPLQPQRRSRLRWKRLGGGQASSNCLRIEIEAKVLARFLVHVHNIMFKHEDLSFMFNLFQLDDETTKMREILKRCHPRYNRASFAFLLSIIKANVVTDWDECMKHLYGGISFSNCTESNGNSELDLALNMHVFGVDSSQFPKPVLADLNDAVLAPVLPLDKDVPDLLCVTIRVPREQLSIFTMRRQWEQGVPDIFLSFEGQSGNWAQWRHFFHSVQLAFGEWHDQVEDDNLSSYPFIKEDSAQLWGTSDLFVSVMVPTSVLLKSKHSVPIVKCQLIPTTQNQLLFNKDLSSRGNIDLIFASSQMSSKDVFITRFMPGMSAIPLFSLASMSNETTSNTLTVQLTHNLKIDSFTGRVTREPDVHNVVPLGFKSLFTTAFRLNSVERKLVYPIPVSRKLGLSPKSDSFFEVIAWPFNPLDPETAFYLFPTFLMKAPSGTTVPVPWTSARVDLDTMPEIDITNTKAISWLNIFVSQMFSAREARIRTSETEKDVRTNLKDVLFSFFIKYTGLQGQRTCIFGLKKVDGIIQTLIFPSCLRLDLANYTVVLDCALIPLTLTMFSDPKVIQFLKELTNKGLCQISVGVHEIQAWNAMMPALTERCRTWKHWPDCEYINKGEVPILNALKNSNSELPICSCGFGKFPFENYLKDEFEKFSDLRYMLNRFGIRAAISPVFAVPYVEDCINQGLIFNAVIGSGTGFKMLHYDKCKKCGSDKRKNSEQQNLLVCSKCKNVKYCSADCQKSDWKAHKPFCKEK